MAKKKEEEKSKGLFDKALELLDTEGIVESLESFMSRPVVGLSTGSLALDYIINPEAGGMQKGKIIELYGPFSSGKSTLALGLCANAVANKEHVLYVDAEGSMVASSILGAGIKDNDKFHLISNGSDVRKTANMIEGLMKTGEVGVVVIDSIPVWKPNIEPKKGEDEVDFTKPKMAFQASFLSEAIPHLATVARQHGIILVLLNQIRKNLSGYGAGTVPYGGTIIEHMDSVRIRLSGKAASTNDRIVDGDGKIIGQYTNCIADKNKTSIPMQEAKVPIFLGRGVNPYMEVAYLSQKVGIVDGTAGRFKWADSGENIAHGINEFTQVLFENKELYLSLRSKVIEKLGIKYQSDRKVVNSFHDTEGNRWDTPTEEK